MLYAIAILIVVAILVYALWGRAWLKQQTWAQGFFAAIEPLEIFLFKKSETILVGRLLWVGGLFVTAYDALALFASRLDLTPVTTRLFDFLHVPPDMRGLTATAALALIGQVVIWLRKRTTKPVEVVAVAQKDITPAVAQALVAAEATKQEAVAAVIDAKAA